MPLVNTYYHNPGHEPGLVVAIIPLKKYIAEILSGERELLVDDVSVRLIKSLGQGMMADVELDIIAATSPNRVEQQDQICAAVREHVLEQLPDISDAKVWLSLSELGYSFDG